MDDHVNLTGAQGHRQVIRHDHAAPRALVPGVGALDPPMPRVHDHGPKGLARHARAALLGAQGRRRAGQADPALAGRREGPIASDPDGRHT